MRVLVFSFLVSILSLTSAYAEKKCIFGEEYFEIYDNSRFDVKEDVIKTFKLSRIAGDEDNLIMVRIDVAKDKITKREFQINTTFRHHDDGDNTWGWIEEVTGAAKSDSGVKNEGQIVALISDSGIDDCKVFDDGSGQTPEKPKKQVFDMIKTPHNPSNPNCYVAAKLELEVDGNIGSVKLTNRLGEGSSCDMYVSPNTRSYQIVLRDEDCGTQIYGEDDDADEGIEVVDNRARLCENVVQALIIVKEFDSNTNKETVWYSRDN